MAEKGGVYVLDEPTTGLHLADVEQLLGLLDRLVDSGKSVIVIEHHQAVMAHADWIIDLGPGAGHDGGRVVFEGTPADLVAARSTLTGEHLADYVEGLTGQLAAIGLWLKRRAPVRLISMPGRGITHGEALRLIDERLGEQIYVGILVARADGRGDDLVPVQHVVGELVNPLEAEVPPDGSRRGSLSGRERRRIVLCVCADGGHGSPSRSRDRLPAE